MYKHIFKKISILVCVVAVVVASMPVYAAKQQIETIEYSVSKVNPIYADVVSANDTTISVIEQETSTFSTGRTYTNVEDAGAYLREQMSARATTVAISYQTTSNDWDAIIAGIVDVAVEHTGNPYEGDYLKFQYKGYDCTMEGTSDGVTNTMTFTYTIQYYTNAEQEVAVSSKVEEVFASLNLDGKTDYEKIKAIYDYVCTNVSYDYANLEDDTYLLKYTAYAALVDQTSVCQGYANLMYRLLLETGIDARIISGISSGERHAWNIVKLGDSYYNIDATWDASRKQADMEYAYFLKNTGDFEDHERNAEYLTEAFGSAYLMSETSYNGEISDTTGRVILETNEYIGACSVDKILVSEGETVTFTVSMAEGYAAKWFYLYKPITQNMQVVYLYETGSGTYTGSFKITDQTESGIWQVRNITYTDTEGNYHYFYNSANYNGSFYEMVDFSPLNFEVVGTNADVTSPILKEFSIDKQMVSQNEEVMISVLIEEEHPASNLTLWYRSPSGDSEYVNLMLINGSTRYEGRLVIDEEMETGLWQARRLYLRDSNDNGSDVYNSNLISGSNYITVDMSCLDFEIIDADENTETDVFIVVFKDGLGSTLSTQRINEGDDAIPPEDPVRDNYIFDGWDGEYDNVTSDLILTAKWKKDPKGTYDDHICVGNSFGVSLTSAYDQTYTFTCDENIEFTPVYTGGTTVSIGSYSRYTKNYSVKISEPGYYYFTIDGSVDTKDLTWSVSVTEHEYDEGAITTEATCVSEGVKTYSCQNEECDASYTEVIPKGTHKLEAVVIQPTCLAEGYTIDKCKNCEYATEKYNVVAATGHNYVSAKSYVVINENTIYENCTINQDVYVEKGVTLTTKGNVTIEGEVYVFGTLYNQGYLVLNGTIHCLKYGSMFSAGDYDYGCFNNAGQVVIDSMDVTDDFLAQGIPSGDIFKEATCTSEGERLYICQNEGCSSTYKEVIPKIPHVWDKDYTIDLVPTYDASGSKSIHCSVCDAIKEDSTVTIPKLEKEENPFTDLEEGYFYVNPVLWAVEHGITSGTSATTFSPNDPCTRGQVVTFLHRAAGKPAPTTTKTAFADLQAGYYYITPVMWAVENGITTGTSATTFSPDATCTRGQVVTFLWRAMGSPKPTSTTNPFTDLQAGYYYNDAVMWAVENGITTGTSATTFGPDEPCTRGQVVTFLYRTYN